jgi:hypothetical protein
LTIRRYVYNSLFLIPTRFDGKEMLETIVWINTTVTKWFWIRSKQRSLRRLKNLMGHSFQPSVFTCMILKLLVLKQQLKYTISCGISFLGPWVNVFFFNLPVKIEVFINFASIIYTVKVIQWITLLNEERKIVSLILITLWWHCPQKESFILYTNC